jgi:uncharacterized protein YgiM (DUF1202 family)
MTSTLGHACFIAYINMPLLGGVFKVHMTPYRVRLAAAAVALLVCASSCSKKEVLDNVELPPTPVLSVQSYWGVIESSYLNVREAPSLDARIIAPLRRGYVVEVLKKDTVMETIDDSSDYWYEVAYDGLRGWVFGAYLRLYDSRGKADNAARELR